VLTGNGEKTVEALHKQELSVPVCQATVVNDRLKKMTLVKINLKNYPQKRNFLIYLIIFFVKKFFYSFNNSAGNGHKKKINRSYYFVFLHTGTGYEENTHGK